jgi:hypothetical protein
MAYIYNADIFCDDCGKFIRGTIEAEGNAPNDPGDESSYDSDEYPKYCDGSSESDCPEHCGAGDTCFNAIEFSDGHKIGVWLENDLTTDGEEYTIEAVLEGGDVADLWREYYDYLSYATTIACNGCGDDFAPDDVDDDNFCEDCQAVS